MISSGCRRTSPLGRWTSPPPRRTTPTSTSNYLEQATGVKTEFVDVDKFGERTDARLLYTVRPSRQVHIVASFPHKAQLEEFKNKLRRPSILDVLSEPSEELPPDDPN